jgi:hypothetical protein
MLDVQQVLNWSAWQSLEQSWRGSSLPNQPGLYRIRRAGSDIVDYIDQTGAGVITLRRRISLLAGVYGAEMPYSDPHTAGPGLWALRRQGGRDFETSTVVVEGRPSVRLELEALAIALYRQEHGASPSLNFGRMPAGYRKSSGNNTHLVTQGKRFRGGAITAVEASHGAGITPVGPLTAVPAALDWCGHQWSGWLPLEDAIERLEPKTPGLYRLREAAAPSLLYIGQGSIAERLSGHLRTATSMAGRQGQLFAAADAIICSWVVNRDWQVHQRLELATDLVGAYVLYREHAPPAQFLG